MSFVTRIRLIMLVAVVMMLAPTVLLVTGQLGRPLMFEGDRYEERICPDCGGSGRSGDQRCQPCLGKGRAHYVLPGPHHPIRFMGLIVDTRQPWKGEGPPPPLPARPPGRGVHPASIRFVASNQMEVPLETNEEGRFAVELPPGDYAVESRAQGLPALKTTLHVPVLTEPIRCDLDLSGAVTRPLLVDLVRGKLLPGLTDALPEAGSRPPEPASPR